MIWSGLVLSTFLIANVSCIKRELRQVAINRTEQSALQTTSRTQTPINLNTASANELETLPGIGRGLAERIVDHRQKYGPFRRPEELIILRGISDKKFRAMRNLISVE